MNEKERQTFITNELEAIYEEFDIYVKQLLLLKPFLKDLIAVSKGADPSYDLSAVFKS